MMRGAAWVLAGVVLSTCGIDTRSGDFTCNSQADCADGRECVDNWCVLGTGGASDAGEQLPFDADQGDCPPECDACMGETCVFLCNTGNACSATIECPDGAPCRVECGGQASCAGGVNCNDATSCEVLCTARNSCSGQVDCGDSDCDVTCTARDSCQEGIDCSTACACDTICDGSGACAGGLECKADECLVGGECTSDVVGCNEC